MAFKYSISSLNIKLAVQNNSLEEKMKKPGWHSRMLVEFYQDIFQRYKFVRGSLIKGTKISNLCFSFTNRKKKGYF